MIVWLWTNIVLTAVALAFAHLNPKAPHRLRFHVCFGALVGWLIPWGRIGQLLPSAPPAISRLLPDPASFDMAAGFLSPTGSPGAAGLITGIVPNADVILLAATIIGAALFANSCRCYLKFVRRIAQGSKSGSHLWAEVPIAMGAKTPGLRVQREVAGAMTTGVLRPTIWIHENLVDHPCLQAALVHELQHVRHHDNAYLWSITLLQDLFWWNPLLRFLAARTRRLQELSCDEACASELSDYKDMLNRLVVGLTGVPRRNCPQASCIHQSNNFNVQRLRALEEQYIMKVRHYVSLTLVLISSFAALGWAAAQESPEKAELPQFMPAPASTDEALRQIRESTGEDLGPIPGFEPGTTLDEAEELYRSLRLYATLLERQFDNQEREIASLKSELAALRDVLDTPADE